MTSCGDRGTADVVLRRAGVRRAVSGQPELPQAIMPMRGHFTVHCHRHARGLPAGWPSHLERRLGSPFAAPNVNHAERQQLAVARRKTVEKPARSGPLRGPDLGFCAPAPRFRGTLPPSWGPRWLPTGASGVPVRASGHANRRGRGSHRQSHHLVTRLRPILPRFQVPRGTCHGSS